MQQLKLFALASGDRELPVGFDALSGGTGDSTTYVPQFTAFAQYIRLAHSLPLEEIILPGDRKMPTELNAVQEQVLKVLRFAQPRKFLPNPR